MNDSHLLAMPLFHGEFGGEAVMVGFVNNEAKELVDSSLMGRVLFCCSSS